jgi:hypothetical protein
MVTGAAFSFMSLSFIITASSSAGDTLFLRAELSTPSAMRSQNRGLQAATRQRILSLTRQMVLARHEADGNAPSASARVSGGSAAGSDSGAGSDAAPCAV